MNAEPFEIAVRNALELYAETSGLSLSEVREAYSQSESTRNCIMLLVLAQADKSKLKTLAAKL